MNKEKNYSSPYEFKGRIPLRKLFPPVVTGTVVLAIGLNLIIPKDKEDHAAEQTAAELAAKKAEKLADQDGQK